jgi:ankyrin repeat protein
MVAVDEGHEGVVDLLLQHLGCLVNLSDDGGGTALHWACAGPGRAGMVARLVAHPGQRSVNVGDSGGSTPLMLAVEEGDMDSVRILLRELARWGAGVDINAMDREGRTALMVAVANERMECVREMVVVPGVDLHTRDRQGRGLEDQARWVGEGRPLFTIKSCQEEH